MYRDGINIFYSEEDKAGLVVRCYSADEIADNKKSFFAEKVKKQMDLFILLIIDLIVLNMFYHETVRFCAYIALAIIVMVLIIVEIAMILNYRNIKSGYFIEIIVDEKKEVEIYSEYSVAAGPETTKLYPIIGRDTTSGYQCICYVEREKYDNAEVGQIIQLNVREAEL